MITDYIGGEGSAETPKNDYVIYGWPLTFIIRNQEIYPTLSRFILIVSGFSSWTSSNLFSECNSRRISKGSIIYGEHMETETKQHLVQRNLSSSHHDDDHWILTQPTRWPNPLSCEFPWKYTTRVESSVRSLGRLKPPSGHMNQAPEMSPSPVPGINEMCSISASSLLGHYQWPWSLSFCHLSSPWI